MQARADRTRRAILEAAAETFEANGYLGTSLQSVVAGRRVSKGAVYFHFSTKKELAAAIIMEQQDLLPKLVAELREHQPRAILLLLQVSQRTARILCGDVMTRAGTRLACEYEQLGGAAPPLFGEWTSTIERLLSEARAQGDLLPAVDIRTVAEFIITSFAGLHRRRYFVKPDSKLDRQLVTMWRVLLPGLVTAGCLTEIEYEIDMICNTK
jgi:AcrR family transcriptional regulator